MNIEQHIEMAQRIERSLEKCGPADHEMRIEAAMLAGTHWLNAALHVAGATAPAIDIFHSYLLTVNEFRRLCIADGARLRALAAIEDLRPPFVRGNWHGGEHAGERALALLAQIRSAVSTRT
ncbi:hypothetical protein SAMN04515620_1154 [Collimonas sp. OK607]|uniref:hypothetical protein n=1 Tax=Collimonas sp. OK607 TaxID=1798194 RepID=UPI0008EB351E|nr:hypothetical protein [Collimonas sp. OK607]SFB05345.1 hypothetical protein SAMN04515620_1154 [Collimonas sp. OK607]